MAPDLSPVMPPGTLYWLTGLSGAGKSTLAGLLAGHIRAAGRPVLHLDGDVLRAIVSAGPVYGAEARLGLALRYGKLAQSVVAQGIDVVCSTISLFHAVQEWNRDNIPGYCEILVDVPLDELRRRDPKGIYRRAEAGDAKDVVGLDVPAEFPVAPDVVVQNWGGDAPEAVAARLWDVLRRPDRPRPAIVR